MSHHSLLDSIKECHQIFILLMTDIECIDLLCHFISWEMKEKKSCELVWVQTQLIRLQGLSKLNCLIIQQTEHEVDKIPFRPLLHHDDCLDVKEPFVNSS